MIFTKSNIAKSVLCANQYRDVQFQRNAANANEAQYQKLIGNAGLIPADVYQDFDRDIVAVMRLDEGDAFLSDLLAMSRSTNIGKLVVKNARAYLDMLEHGETLDYYLWGYVDGVALQNRRRSMGEIPANTPLSN